MEDLLKLEKKLSLDFNDYSRLSRALTHRSFVNENAGVVMEDNERLEFLGDAVLDFVVGEYLYHRFPEMDEGDLTSLRAALVRTEFDQPMGDLLRFFRVLERGGLVELEKR